ncbi:hypothetical protein [Streptomyces sp. H39-S7]|uniref:hypothetical protein n=1 Tax=Streptomyces sp. H39-S7 TaxID=3004357 RepID=UPI0022AF4787|nr:hypothetical protein [Streptomyces sp. H39-S7]MCZ4123453.1 hypothetical protein [Streptomyces sp. H39-S7]
MSPFGSGRERDQLFEVVLANVDRVYEALCEWIMNGPRPPGLLEGEFPIPDRKWVVGHTNLTDGMVLTALATIAATGAVSVPAPGIWRFNPDSDGLDAEDARERATTVIDLFISYGIPARIPRQAGPRR